MVSSLSDISRVSQASFLESGTNSILSGSATGAGAAVGGIASSGEFSLADIKLEAMEWHFQEETPAGEVSTPLGRPSGGGP